MGIVDVPPRHPLLLGNAYRVPLPTLLGRAGDDAFLRVMRVLGPGALARALALEGGVPAPIDMTRFGSCSLCYAMAADASLLERVIRFVETDRFRDMRGAS